MARTNELSRSLSIFQKGARTGDTGKFILPLGYLLYYLGSSTAIEVAIQQIRLLSVKHINLQTSNMNNLLTSLALLGPEFSPSNPLSMPKDFHDHTDQSMQDFVEAMRYLLEAVNTRVEGIRIHAAKRSIRHIIYAYLSEFEKTYDRPRNERDTFFNDPKYIQYRIGIFTPLLEDIEKRILEKASNNLE